MDKYKVSDITKCVKNSRGLTDSCTDNWRHDCETSPRIMSKGILFILNAEII